MKTRLFSILFAIVFMMLVYSKTMGNITIFNFFRPFIVIILIAWLYLNTKLKGRFHKRIFTGLIFALAGDVCFVLQTGHSNFFTYGWMAFLICHVFYIRAFTLDHKSNPNFKNPFFLWAAVALIIFCTGLFFYLQPFLGALQFAILMYAIMITFMAIMAVNRYGKVNTFSYKLIFYGTLFFLLSDSVLAVNNFTQPIPHADVLILATYMIAQYLIVYGSVERKLLVTKTEL